MPVYMTQFTYTREAWAALTQNPVDRREGLRRCAHSNRGWPYHGG
jgi:hypothetical protein